MYYLDTFIVSNKCLNNIIDNKKLFTERNGILV